MGQRTEEGESIMESEKKIERANYEKQKSSEKRKKNKLRKLGKCGDKVKHKTHEHACAARNSMLKENETRKNPIVSVLNVYQCPKCNSWHVGRNKGMIDWDLVKKLTQK